MARNRQAAVRSPSPDARGPGDHRRRELRGVDFHISAGGAKVQSLDVGKVEEIVLLKSAVLDIPDYGGYEGDIVWIDDEFIGIEFHENHKTMVKLITGQSAVTAA